MARLWSWFAFVCLLSTLLGGRDAAAESAIALHSLLAPLIPGVVNGRPSEARREVVQIGVLDAATNQPIPSCSGTVVGDGSIVSAAHCAQPGAKMVAWLESPDGKSRAMVDIACERHPSFPKRNMSVQPVLNSTAVAMLLLARAAAETNPVKQRSALDSSSRLLLDLMNGQLRNSGEPALDAWNAPVTAMHQSVLDVMNGHAVPSSLRAPVAQLEKLYEAAAGALYGSHVATSQYDVALCSFTRPASIPVLTKACLPKARALTGADDSRSGLIVGFGCERSDDGKLLYREDPEWARNGGTGTAPRIRTEAAVKLERKPGHRYDGSWDPKTKSGDLPPGETAACGGDSGGAIARVLPGSPERLALEAITVASGAIQEHFDFEKGRFVAEYAATPVAVGGIDVIDPASPARKFIEERATAPTSLHKVELCEGDPLVAKKDGPAPVPGPEGGPGTLPEGFTPVVASNGARTTKFGPVEIPREAVGYRVQNGMLTYLTASPTGFVESVPASVWSSGSGGGAPVIPQGFVSTDLGGGRRITGVSGIPFTFDVLAYGWDPSGRLLVYRNDGRVYYASR